jgi:lipoprotein-anchoring transpeptidase ErfK/SrfK
MLVRAAQSIALILAFVVWLAMGPAAAQPYPPYGGPVNGPGYAPPYAPPSYPPYAQPVLPPAEVPDQPPQGVAGPYALDPPPQNPGEPWRGGPYSTPPPGYPGGPSDQSRNEPQRGAGAPYPPANMDQRAASDPAYLSPNRPPSSPYPTPPGSIGPAPYAAAPPYTQGPAYGPPSYAPPAYGPPAAPGYGPPVAGTPAAPGYGPPVAGTPAAPVRPPADVDPKREGAIAALPPEERPDVQPRELPANLRRQVADFPTKEATGTIIIDTANTYLYYVLGHGKAIRYGIGVGREGFTWSGVERISKMAEWPDWYPPSEMIDRQPYLPRMMAGGLSNPLGARALYLGSTVYRIHGTNQPSTIGQFVSSGCIRMLNEDVEDLYSRVTVGTRVVVLPGPSGKSASIH